MKKIKVIGEIFVFIIILFLISVIILCSVCLFFRKHSSVITQGRSFTESTNKLDNPYRGFYSIYGFLISDDEADFLPIISQYLNNSEDKLVLVQINLVEYVTRDISQKGINNIELLLAELSQLDKHYIVRFLYDWEGNAEENEPDNIDIILRHMEQLAPLFNKYQDNIFINQGIFVGDCGEMHGSNYLSSEEMGQLMNQLNDIIPDNIYLSVRTPQQWRILTGITNTEGLNNHNFAFRLGLFNDGMMGTSLDTGTYGDKSRSEVGNYEKWSRQEELEFQEKLCKYVPNGGEVVIENYMNDFQNAVESMKTMHITYLNKMHDQEVLNKWADTIVVQEGCYNGMDGLNYIDRHLGYRLLIHSTNISYENIKDKLTVEVNLQNVGFAPTYRDSQVYIILKNRDTLKYLTFEIPVDISVLSGGNDADEKLLIKQEVTLSGYSAGQYDIFFNIKDVATGKHILLANEQEAEEYGYKIGGMIIEPIRNPFTKEEIVFK